MTKSLRRASGILTSGYPSPTLAQSSVIHVTLLIVSRSLLLTTKVAAKGSSLNSLISVSPW
jgi:hypothetical protein